MIEKLLLTFGIATALSLSAPDAAAAPKGGDLTGDAFLKEVPATLREIPHARQLVEALRPLVVERYARL